MLIIFEDYAKYNLRMAAELHSSQTSELAIQLDSLVGYHKSNTSLKDV